MRDTDGQWTVHKGDHITIQAQGTTISGTVLSATFWGGTDGWYIELTPDYGLIFTHGQEYPAILDVR